MGAGLLLLTPQTWAAPEVLEPPPPLAEEQSLTVYRGESAVITLRARGRDARKAKFLLRSKPRLGQLGTLSPAHEGFATIPYQAGLETGVDEFTFAVQGPSSPVSAPGRVRIFVVPRPPRLHAPESLDLGELPVGGEMPTVVELANAGDGLLRGKLVVEGDWHLGIGEDFSIAGGEKLLVPLTFTPSEEREYAGTLRILGPHQRTISLRARARLQWRVHPMELEISRSQDAMATVKISNYLPEPLDVEISGPEGVLFSPLLTVPAEGEVSLPVRRRPDFVGAQEGHLVLATRLGEERLPVKIFPLPPKVVLQSSRTLDFTSQDEGRAAVVWKNSGGLPAELSWETPEFLRSTPVSPLLLPPGESREVEFQLRGRPVLRGAPELSFRSGEQIFSLGMQLPALPEAESPPAMRPRPGVAVPEPPMPPTTSTPLVEDQLPIPFHELQLLRRSQHELVFSFQDATANVDRHRLERREIVPNEQGELAIRWVEFPPTLTEELPDRTIRYTLQNLPAGVRFPLRIVALDRFGEPIAQTSTFSLETLPAPNHFGPALKTLVLVLMLGAALAWLVHRRRLQQKAAEDEDRRRIAALEAERNG